MRREEEYAAAIPAAETQEAEILARLLSARADIAIKRGAMDDALELHRQALEIQIAKKEMLLAHRDPTINMGYIFRRRRDTRHALEVYGNVEELLDSETDPNLMDARVRLASAFLSWVS